LGVGSLMGLFVINKPEDIDLLPDNKKAGDTETFQLEKDKMIADSWTLQEAMKTKEFWLMD